MTIDDIKNLCIARRKELQLTQAQVGKLAGIRREMIVRFENDSPNDLGLRRFLRLLLVLELDMQLRPGTSRPNADDLSELFPDE